MTVQTKTGTAEELLEIPDYGLRRELVGGELREMTPSWKLPVAEIFA